MFVGIASIKLACCYHGIMVTNLAAQPVSKTTLWQNCIAIFGNQFYDIYLSYLIFAFARFDFEINFT